MAVFGASRQTAVDSRLLLVDLARSDNVKACDTTIQIGHGASLCVTGDFLYRRHRYQ